MVICQKPECPARQKRKLFTERGFFQHLDTKLSCKEYYNRIQKSNVAFPPPTPVAASEPASCLAAAEAEETILPPSDNEDSNNHLDDCCVVNDEFIDIGESNLEKLICLDDNHENDSDGFSICSSSGDCVEVLNLPLPDFCSEEVVESEGSVCSFSNDTHSRCSDFSSQLGSEDHTMGDDDCTEDIESAVQAPTLPPTNIYPVQTNTDGRPPKVFDYAEHQDGLYTPRKWIQQWIEWSRSSFEKKTLANPDQTILPDNLSLLNSLLEDPNYGPTWRFMSASERLEIELMSTLNGIKGCPLYVYDAVVKWAKSTVDRSMCLEENDSPILLMRSRDMFVKDYPSFAHTANMIPVTRNVELPGCKKITPLTTTSYTANLYHFLTDRNLVNDNTLLIPGATPHDSPPSVKPEYYDDVDTGSRYLDAYAAMKEEDIDFPCGDIWFVDKSHVDSNGRLCAEPVNHTFTCQ